MKIMYAPWRGSYIKDTNKTRDKKSRKNDCVFCQHISESNDKSNLVVRRFPNCFACLNLFPYSSGHVLVIPNEHIGELEDVSADVQSEIMHTTSLVTQALKKSLHPDGFNIGINLGNAGGGGIPAHMHVHVLPRWTADTNYMTTISDTRVLSVDLYEVYDKIKESLDELCERK
ncbi:HIT domain-containing protein [bacterium]|jgi:ATP adenylyltransferase|nr:HIT domain-containing protein [bacterium]